MSLNGPFPTSFPSDNYFLRVLESNETFLIPLLVSFDVREKIRSKEQTFFKRNSVFCFLFYFLYSSNLVFSDLTHKHTHNTGFDLNFFALYNTRIYTAYIYITLLPHLALKLNLAFVRCVMCETQKCRHTYSYAQILT